MLISLVGGQLSVVGSQLLNAKTLRRKRNHRDAEWQSYTEKNLKFVKIR